MSNSKLTSEQKQFRKEAIYLNPHIQFFSFPEMGVTVAICETGINMGAFSVSIASVFEQKFRRKVGEYMAIKRMVDGQILPVKIYDGLQYVAAEIARAVSC